MDIISFILSLALEKGSDSSSASSVTYDPSTSVGLISTDVQDAIDELSTRGGLKNEIVQVLPQTGEEGICYFVPNNSSEVENIYDEYIWFDSLNDYEKIGSTKVDISDLLKSEAITEPYDDTKTYDVGDYVTYLGYLCKCKTAVTTAQSFDPAKWDKIDIFTYIKNDGADYIANEKTYNALSTNDKTLTGAINEITGIVGSDNAPYVYRQTPFIASQENLKSIVGGSVVWNQLVNTLNPSAEVYGITRTKVSTDIKDGLRVYGTCTASTYFPIAQIDNFNAEHKYFVSLGNVVLPSGSKLYLQSVTTANMQKDYVGTLADTPIAIYIVSGVAIDVIVKPQVFDLTAMFGSTIADYIYSLEQATAGSGIAWLKKYGFFTKPYYAYSANTMQSVNVSAHNTVGFNQFDEVMEIGNLNTNGTNGGSTDRMRSKNYIPIVDSNLTYCFKMSDSSFVRICQYDKNKTFIKYSDHQTYGGVDYTTFTVQSDCAYIRFNLGPSYGTTYKNDICINLHWDGERDGEYEPYKKNSYDLSGSHEVQRKYAENSDWSTIQISQNNITDSTYEVIVGLNNNKKAGFNNFVCNKLEYKTWADDGTYGIRGYSSSGDVAIRFPVSVVSAVAQARQWLTDNSVVLIYEKATPTTETVTNPTLRGIPKLDANNNLYYDGDSMTDFVNIQVAGYYGTEEFVDAEESAGNRDVAIPVGHNTDYFNSSILAYNIDYTDDKCEELKDYIDEQIQQSITNVLNTSY